MLLFLQLLFIFYRQEYNDTVMMNDMILIVYHSYINHMFPLVRIYDQEDVIIIIDQLCLVSNYSNVVCMQSMHYIYQSH